MPTLSDCAVWLQDILGESLQDDIGAIEFVQGDRIPLPDHSALRWQLAVDVIYRCSISGLIQIFLTCGTTSDNVLPGLQKVNPFLNEGGFVWNGTYFRCTKRLRELFESFPGADARNGPADVAFIGALAEIFAKHGVAWSEHPILAIGPTNK